MQRYQSCFSLSKRSAAILLPVPVRRANMRQEVLHRREIAVEQAAVEIARIPVNQDAAQIKDDDGAAWLLHRHSLSRQRTYYEALEKARRQSRETQCSGRCARGTLVQNAISSRSIIAALPDLMDARSAPTCGSTRSMKKRAVVSLAL